MQRLARNVYTLGASKVARKRLDLFYDVVSPYTWFAFEVLMRYRKHWDVEVQLKPMLLAGVNHALGKRTPLFIPNKVNFTIQDLKRNATYFNVPLNMVKNPFELMMEKGSLIPNRFLTAIDLLYPDHLESASRALWMEAWNKDEDFTTPEVLIRAGQAAGLTGEQLARIQQYMTQQSTKDRLRAHTDEALSHGAFGSPTIVAHIPGEEPMLFFGSDRFPVLAQEIGEKWLGPEPDALLPKL